VCRQRDIEGGGPGEPVRANGAGAGPQQNQADRRVFVHWSAKAAGVTCRGESTAITGQPPVSRGSEETVRRQQPHSGNIFNEHTHAHTHTHTHTHTHLTAFFLGLPG